MGTGSQEASEVCIVLAGDGERPRRERGTVTVEPSRLRVALGIKTCGWRGQHALVFWLYQGRPSLLPLSSWLAASLGRPLPVIPDNIRVRVLHAGRARASIDPPWPLDFTLHLYGTESFIQSTVATFVAAAT